MNRILIAESDSGLAHQIKEILIDGNNYPISCDTLEQTRKMLGCEKWTLVIADERLSDGNGLDLLDDIDSGVIFVAILPENSNADEMELLTRGVADYIRKPFSPVVLKAKAITQIERRRKAKLDIEDSARFDAIGATSPQFTAEAGIVHIDKYEFDFDNREYRYLGHGVRLGVLEERLLRLLVENRGVVLKRTALMERLRTEDGQGLDEERLAHTIDSLKNELNAASFIKTVYGVGFMWAVNKEK